MRITAAFKVIIYSVLFFFTFSCFIVNSSYLHFQNYWLCKTSLTHSWRRPLSYRNQSIDLFCKSMDWFLYDNDLRHERVNPFDDTGFFLYPLKTSKTRSFFMFSGGYKRDYLHEIGNFFCNRKYINERPSKCMQSLRNVCPRFK